MPLQQGSRIASYEITSSIGAGGMGEVYRGRDTRLQRDVALKVLPAGFASDPDRLARFAREAQVLASFNHPNIAQIYGFEDAGASSALVMELVEGEDLAARIRRGALPLDEALGIAHQVAQALEAAHERGIIHRDLKPANIKVTPDGTVKVLDFGLAKAFDASGPEGTSDSALMNSPTMSIAATRAGVILGTAAYMAPEQARGQAVDRRADIWAFGVVLFEMLTGRAAFEGETTSDVLASVLKNDLDWSVLPAGLPQPILSLLRRCLTPDRKNRLRDIGEARIAIADYLANPVAASPSVAPARTAPPSRTLRTWQAIAALLAVAAIALAVMLVGRPAEERRISKFEVHAPAKTILSTVSRPVVSLSPDGRLMAFAAIQDGTSRLYVQRFDQFEARPLPGTEGASEPVISPDGESIAFTTGNALKVVRLDGAIVTLATVNDPRGMDWVDNETLVISPEAISGLVEVTTGGGPPRAVTTIPENSRERTHRWPSVLPGGRYVLFTVGGIDSPDNYDDAAIDAVDRQTGERRRILPAGSMTRYLPTGHLAYARGGMLFAIGFDAKTLQTSGTPKPILQGVAGDSTTGAAHVSWAADGTFAYVAGDATGGLRRLVWVNRKGEAEAIQVPDNAAGTLYNDMRISPDRSRVALSLGSSGRADIWVYAFDRRTFTRLTFTGTNATPIWSSDGRELYFSSVQANDRATDILRMHADGGVQPVKVATFDKRVYLKFVSRDGTWGVVDRPQATSPRGDVLRFTLAETPALTPIAATPFEEYAAAVSPDGRWVAYQSDESGRPEVYVRPVDGTGGRWQVSSGGGEEPMWAPAGNEIYFRDNNRLLVVPVNARDGFRAGTPSMLFDGIFNLRSDTGVSYDVDPKGERFVMVRQATDLSSPASLRIVLNWFDEVKRQMSAR